MIRVQALFMSAPVPGRITCEFVVQFDCSIEWTLRKRPAAPLNFHTRLAGDIV